MLLFKLCDIFFWSHLSHSLAAEWVCGLFPPQLFVLLKKGVDLSKMSKIRKSVEQQVSIHADQYQQNNQTKLSRKKKRKKKEKEEKEHLLHLALPAALFGSSPLYQSPSEGEPLTHLQVWSDRFLLIFFANAISCFKLLEYIWLQQDHFSLIFLLLPLLRLYTQYLEWHSLVAGAKALCLQASFQSLAN